MKMQKLSSNLIYQTIWLMSVLFASLFLATSANNTVYAATYYVSKNGDNSNPGTFDKPWLTINHAADAARAGDTIRLLPGTYDGKIAISKSGAPEMPITIISDSYDFNQYAIIDGGGVQGQDSNKYGFRINDASWIVLENLKFRNCWNTAVYISNSNYISLKGCDILGTSRVVYASGQGTHHILIEHCHWKAEERVWTEWSWDNVKCEGGDPCIAPYLAQSSIYCGGSAAGGAVIRNNHIEYTFNAFQYFADTPNSQANIEVYGNQFHHIRDNIIEPEEFAFNLHVYHNILDNCGSYVISIDSVEGGPIYLYGNVGYMDPSDRPKVGAASGGVYKFVTGERYLDQPLYAFHNSWYYKLGVRGHRYQHHVHHFNNAYYFTDSKGLDLKGWNNYESLDNNFDYDCSNQPWPTSIIESNQEKKGIVSDPEFRNPSSSDFKLQSDSPCIDAGKIIPGFTQGYEGFAPDIGAYEGDRLVEGPPFQFLEPPGGSLYVEKPRIVRARVSGNQLTIFFSTDINPSTINKNSIVLRSGGQEVAIQSVGFPESPRALMVASDQQLDENNIAIGFDPLPTGTNGETATYWASVLETLIDSEDTLPPSPPKRLRISNRHLP